MCCVCVPVSCVVIVTDSSKRSAAEITEETTPSLTSDAENPPAAAEPDYNNMINTQTPLTRHTVSSLCYNCSILKNNLKNNV